jgi:thioredoxin
MSLIAIHENSLAEQLAGDTPTLVEFSATWCGPCRSLAVVLEEVAAELRGRLSVVTLDADDNLDAARRLQVMAVPTMILFSGGEPVLRLVGARGKSQLLRELAEYLPAS